MKVAAGKVAAGIDVSMGHLDVSISDALDAQMLSRYGEMFERKMYTG